MPNDKRYPVYSVFYVTKLFAIDSIEERPKRPKLRFRPNETLLKPNGSEKGQNGEDLA